MTITDTTICGDCGAANGEHRVACSKFSLTSRCGICGERHMPKAHCSKPLPPTAEETSVGRFNALAGEIRAIQAKLDIFALNQVQVCNGIDILVQRSAALLEAIQLGQQETDKKVLLMGSLQWDSLGKALKELTGYCQVTAEIVTKMKGQVQRNGILLASLERPAKPQPSGKRGKGARHGQR